MSLAKTNVLFITYNSTLTGSKALRKLNEFKCIQDGLYSNKNANMVSSYCSLYDKAKKNEPFYDVLASQIACMNQINFDNHFKYVPVNLVEEGTNYESFHPSQPDPLVFKMESKELMKNKQFTRNDLNTYYKYNDLNTEHVFIYGPITDTILWELQNRILHHIKHNSQFVIHLQGENFLDNEGVDGTMIFGMESKGNLFKNSFNYQNCMKNAQKLRQLIQSTYGCEAFTICCTSESRVYEVNGEKFVWTNKDKTISPIKGGLPTIYLHLYEDICKLIQGTLPQENNSYEKLKITTIYQDMVDKDNSSSVVFLLLNSTFNAHIVLIGREAFNLQYKGTDIPHYQSLNCSFIPDVIKPTDISDTHKNIELDMSKTTSNYWPAFKDDHYELDYNSYISVNHYIIMCKGFMICVNDLLKIYGTFCDNYSNDHSLYIAKVSDVKKMPLMNEILFFPALNTLIHAINNVDNTALKDFHPDLTKITSNASYLTDRRLADIYTEYLNARSSLKYTF